MTEQLAVDHTRRVMAGFIGSGFMGGIHSRASRAAGGVLVGVSSSNLVSAVEAAERLGCERAFSTEDELLDDAAIDVVHICTPNATHASLAHSVLSSGKHVICEKPMGLDFAEAQDLAEHAADAGLIAAVPFVYRYHPLVQEARIRFEIGRTGPLTSVSGNYFQDWLSNPEDDDWRVDSKIGGRSRAFADIGSHLCDLIEFVSGSRVVRLTAIKKTVYPERAINSNIVTEDIAAVLVEMDDGAIGTLMVSQVAPGHKNALSIQLMGTRETVKFEQQDPETLWIGRREESSFLRRDPSHARSRIGMLNALPAGHPWGYQDCFNAFVTDVYSSIRARVPLSVEVPGFQDGVRSAAIVAAVLESVEKQGIWIEVAQ